MINYRYIILIAKCSHTYVVVGHVLLVLHAVLAIDSLRQHCVTVDEGAHLLSGLLAWEQGRFDFYYVNPPLVKLLTSLPMVIVRPSLPEQVRWGVSEIGNWFIINDIFINYNINSYQKMVICSRIVNVVLSLVGGWVMYRWSRQLFSRGAGLVALALWALCPNVLGWAGVCTVDLGTTVFGLATGYTLWLYLRCPSGIAAVLVGWALGLALLSKFTLLVLIPVVILICLAAHRRWRGLTCVDGSRPRWLRLGLLLTISLLVVNVGYGFQGTCRPLGEFPFKCRALSRLSEASWFRSTWLERLPVPLPDAFVRGLDEQKSLTDNPTAAYLHGQWHRGWQWYYYLYVLAVKMPLGTLALAGLALILMVGDRRYRAGAWEEGLIWLPAVAVITLISTQMRDAYASVRYILPAFPFMFLGISRVGIVLEDGWKLLNRWPIAARPLPALGGAMFIIGAIIGNGFSVMRVHPHELSYFNEIAGGPDRGWEHLIESNIDWGQDLLFLKRWVDQHPEARPLGLAYYGGIDPHLLGLKYHSVPRGGAEDSPGPHPGWYAVSVNLLFGQSIRSFDQDGKYIFYNKDDFNYFRLMKPVGKAGYSIFVYHVTREEADRVRAQLDRPPISDYQHHN